MDFKGKKIDSGTEKCLGSRSQGLATVDFISARPRRPAEELDPPGSNPDKGAPEMVKPLRAAVRQRGASPGAGMQSSQRSAAADSERPCVAPLGDRGEAQNPPRLSMNPLLKMEAQALQSRPHRGLAGVPRDAGRGQGSGRPGPRRADSGAPRTRAGESPRSCRLTSSPAEPAPAGLPRRYLMRTSRLKRIFGAGVPFSAPPLAPQEKNRVFNLSRS